MSEDKDVQAKDSKEQEVEATEVETKEVKTEEVKEQETKEVETKEEVKTEERTVYTMPVSKAQKEKERAVEKARQEALEQAEADKQKLIDEYEQKLAASQSTGEIDEKLKKWADDNGYDAIAAKGLVDVIKGSIPVQDTSKYDELLESQKIEAEKAKVSSEFDEKVATLIIKDYPQATPEHIRKVKERIEELAFTEGYNAYRLEDIYKVKKDEFEFKNNPGAEPSGGRASEMVDFSNITDEEENELAKNDPETFKKLIEWQNAQGSRYLT